MKEGIHQTQLPDNAGQYSARPCASPCFMHKYSQKSPDIAQKNKIMQMQSKWQNWPGKKRKLYQQRNRQRKSFIREAQLHESPDIKDDWNVVVAHISFCHSIARLLDALRP
eukprot:scaffold32141_cov22-Tisochrysis_lutea.AAC.1